MRKTCYSLASPVCVCCSSSTDNKTWAEDEVDEASQQNQRYGEGAASSSTGGRAEGAQTGAGVTDNEGNATSGSTNPVMETGVPTTAH